MFGLFSDNTHIWVLPTPLTGSDQTGQNHDCFSSQAWPQEIKPQAGLMPAWTINLLFIANLKDHHKASVKEKKVSFDVAIIVDLLLLGWLLQWIHPVSCLD